jgi:hypothetical protein
MIESPARGEGRSLKKLQGRQYWSFYGTFRMKCLGEGIDQGTPELSMPLAATLMTSSAIAVKSVKSSLHLRAPGQ